MKRATKQLVPEASSPKTKSSAAGQLQPAPCKIKKEADLSKFSIPANSGKSTIEERAKEAVTQQMRQNTTLAAVVFMSVAVAFAGCGGGSAPPPAPPTTPVTQNASITGQYNLVLTSRNGQGTTNVYTDFTQTGTTFTGAASTLVCPSNDLSQCKGGDAPDIPIAPSGTVSGTDVTIAISLQSTTGADTITMVGSVTGTSLAGTYTDSLGDSGTWTASAAIHPVPSPPGVYDYSGTFNSTSNPMLIAPTIFIELGQDAISPASFHVTGKATIMNSPCISSLTLSGQAIGDAFSLADAASKASIIVLPTVPPGNSLTFGYKFEPTAASCAGDFGRGVLTINPQPWDY